MWKKILLVLTMIGQLYITSLPVSALYKEEPIFENSVYVVPKTMKETIVLTGTVYPVTDTENVIGTVFMAQNKSGCIIPTGNQEKDFVPNAYDGVLRETCVIPLGVGEISILTNDKNEVISIQTQNEVKNLLNYFSSPDDLKTKLVEQGINTKLNTLDLLECEQVAIVEILEEKEFETIATFSEEKKEMVERFKEIAKKHIKLENDFLPDIQIVDISNTSLTLNRKPKDNEYLFMKVKGKEYRITEQFVSFDETDHPYIYGRVTKKVPCYLKDIPNLEEKAGNEFNSRDGVALNWVGFVEQENYKVSSVLMEQDSVMQLLFDKSEQSNDILYNSNTFSSYLKFKNILPVLYLCLITITGGSVYFYWQNRRKGKGEKGEN